MPKISGLTRDSVALLSADWHCLHWVMADWTPSCSERIQKISHCFQYDIDLLSLPSAHAVQCVASGAAGLECHFAEGSLGRLQTLPTWSSKCFKILVATGLGV